MDFYKNVLSRVIPENLTQKKEILKEILVIEKKDNYKYALDREFSLDLDTYAIVVDAYSLSSPLSKNTPQKRKALLRQLLSYSSNFSRTLPNGLTPKEKAESLLYNLNYNFSKFRLKLPENFILEKEIISKHPGAPNELNIRYKTASKENLDIATINFYFVKKGNSVELRVNVIQGLLNTKRKDINRKEVFDNFNKLNSFFKEYWRVAVIRGIKDFAKKGDYKLICEMPRNWEYGGVSPVVINRYLKYSFEYLESFIKAGIPVENIDFQRVYKGTDSKTKQEFDFKEGFYNLVERIKGRPLKEQERIIENLRSKQSKLYVVSKKAFASKEQTKAISSPTRLNINKPRVRPGLKAA